MNNFTDWEQKARLLRKLCLTSTTEAQSGHPTSCLSAVDAMTVLFDSFFRYDLSNPLNSANDRLIFSKGHASPLFYALYAMAGGLPIDELNTLRKFGSRLEGHLTPAFPYTDAATGSLGQGLSVGAGLALAIQKTTNYQLPTTPRCTFFWGMGNWQKGRTGKLRTLPVIIALIILWQLQILTV